MSFIEENNAQEAIDTAFERIYPDFGAILDALLADCPYDLYWFDKTHSPVIGGVGYSYDTNGVYFEEDSCLKISMSIIPAYQVSDYVFDTSKSAMIQHAVEKAASIVEQYSSASDYDKLLGYCRTICALTDYNHDAVDNNAAYGDPWQIIYVFDEDPDTKVVCEGYSKAFQYLCDLTQFQNNVICYRVSGQMDGSAHMWNLVRMPNGKTYMVDITNSDNEMIDERPTLFLIGYYGGNYLDGYIYRADLSFDYC